ncbi:MULTISPECIES: hypothetical protein [unclassified Crossiella]|uniref:hypothetical protein n=1 Tax=unclassified Crossiella TaxID=2620835 RepID=UPI001FFFF5F0|nr:MULTISPECIES: hypothetical protein [unclassified Crossiella]MCK2245282.1 hypothetical protein [Crossiella sp. S99.2]MCK2258934.1 hypothetical protein [Crossiella sp. S99.1]
MSNLGCGPYIGAAELTQRGWTETMITKLLGEPDHTTPNRGRRAGGRIRYWLITTVEQIENTEQFQQLLAAADSRRASQQRGRDCS